MFQTARQGQSLDTQRDALINADCDAQHLYSDVISGTTGTKWSYPGLSSALAYMRPGDTFVVTYLDRLGRNLYETVTTVADLAERDINVQVLDPALDTSRPADKVIVNVMANLAEWERELLVERTCEGGVAHARTGQSGWP